ncbi:MAG: CDP-alcohol phosphatidyltransferase family protein [Candidatus Aminicenantes bacterium]|nr:CDP-alcohol phosphatidyltransferase family protein [Candidatus Aminicenantes bacterium]
MRAQKEHGRTPKPSLRLFPVEFLDRLERWTEKHLAFCGRVKVSPNVLTGLGFLAGLEAGLFFALRRPVLAGAAVVVCGALDILDGQVAARTNRRTKFGALLDSTLDRYAEFCMYFGLALSFRGTWLQWVPVGAFLGSVMVSYTRARAEGLGFECREGFMQRAERLILLALASLAGPLLGVFDIAMTAVLGLIALVSNITAVQRTLLVRALERGPGKEKRSS